MRVKETVCYILAVLSLAMGALLRYVYTAVRFTGFLFWCAAAVLVLYALLDRWEQRHVWAKWCKRIFLILLLAGVMFFTVLEARVVSQARTDWYTEPEAIVILGAGVNGREPSLSLEKRLETALYYIGQTDIPVIVTGSQGPNEEISEAACMAFWLADHGVPADRLLLEEQANTTVENVRYSKEILTALGVPADAPVALVTSDYHLCRTMYLWGEGAVPVAAGMPDGYWPMTLNYYVREAFALAAVMVSHIFS
ncbi:MAG: YdcF family protein [Oscillospiraceae bacterium]|nr:YdcF family protein [Oscillospiraceae bacterium]